MNKLFLMESFHNGEWIPHTVWPMANFRLVLNLLKDKSEEVLDNRRIRRVKSRVEAERLYASHPNIPSKARLEYIEWSHQTCHILNAHEEKEETMRIENWRVIGTEDPYCPPERMSLSISGEVYGNPEFPDGLGVTTSYVKSINGSQVTTHSGSVYTLGEPNAEYVEWCRENGCHVPTSETPIKVYE